MTANSKLALFAVLVGVLAVVGLVCAPRIEAALLAFVYPPDAQVDVSRTIEPAQWWKVGAGGVMTVTIDVVNDAAVPLRGFYYSDQVADDWVVGTAQVVVNGLPIADYVYSEGSSGQVADGLTPRRWAFETPQGGGFFSPTHPIPASGGTARLVYTMLVGEGGGIEYALDGDAWAGWLESTPTGTAVFGYQDSLPSLEADFVAHPLIALPGGTVWFADCSVGDVMTYTWSFGDGEVGWSPNPTHSYSSFGVYTVTLMVEDGYRADVVQRGDYIHIVDVVYSLYLPLVMRNDG